MARPLPRGATWRSWLIALVIAALGAGGIFLARLSRSDDESLQTVATRAVRAADMVPGGALLLATVDVAALRASVLGRALLGEGRHIAGLGLVGEICGVDPMRVAQQLALAIPARAEHGGFGIFASGPFMAERLLACAERVARARGGQPVRGRERGFAMLRDGSGQLSSALLAVRDGGPLVLAEPSYVRASIATVSGGHPGAGRDPEHHRLRTTLPAGAVMASLVLSPQQRESLLAELNAQGEGDSPWGALQAGALSLQFGDPMRLDALLRCRSAAACLALAERIKRWRLQDAGGPIFAALHREAWLDRLQVEAQNDLVRLHVEAKELHVASLVKRLLTLWGGVKMPVTPASASPSGAAPSSEPPSAKPPSSSPARPARSAGPRGLRRPDK